MAVEDIIATQQEFAANAVAGGDVFLQALSDIAQTSYFYVDSGASIPPLNFGNDTTQDAVDLLLSLFPDDLDVGDIEAVPPTYVPTTVDDIQDIQVPDFTASAPAVDIPQPPSTALPSAPTAPGISEPAIPDAPLIALPSAPTLVEITIPDPPAIVIPEFTSSAPIDTLVAPSNDFAFYEVAYASELLDATKMKLLVDMETGGYGIEPADESALWERARAREEEATEAQIEDILVQSAQRGYPLPPGDTNVAIQKAMQARLDKLSELSRDIALKRADLYVDNRKFTISEVRALETVLIGYHGSVMERALNAAKATLEASIQIFNAQVAKYNAQLDAYKTEAQVFESRVRAALAHMEIYKAEIEGKKVAAEVQKTKVDVYNAQLNGLNLVLSLYKTQMDAAQVQAQIEQTRISAFRALVDAYQAQVQAKTAEYGMYESRIKGEMSKVQIYQAQASAYEAVVSGAKVRSDIALGRLKADVEVANHAIEVFKAQTAQYQSDIDGQAKVIASETQVFTAKSQGAASKANAISDAYKLELQKRDLTLKRNIEQANIALKDAENLLTAAIKSADIRGKAAGDASGYYTALVGSALNSIGTLSSLVQQL